MTHLSISRISISMTMRTLRGTITITTQPFAVGEIAGKRRVR
jgi:hypothetical protein